MNMMLLAWINETNFSNQEIKYYNTDPFLLHVASMDSAIYGTNSHLVSPSERFVYSKTHRPGHENFLRIHFDMCWSSLEM